MCPKCAPNVAPKRPQRCPCPKPVPTLPQILGAPPGPAPRGPSPDFFPSRPLPGSGSRQFSGFWGPFPPLPPKNPKLGGFPLQGEENPDFPVAASCRDGSLCSGKGWGHPKTPKTPKFGTPKIHLSGLGVPSAPNPKLGGPRAPPNLLIWGHRGPNSPNFGVFTSPNPKAAPWEYSGMG